MVTVQSTELKIITFEDNIRVYRSVQWLKNNIYVELESTDVFYQNSSLDTKLEIAVIISIINDSFLINENKYFN